MTTSPLPRDMLGVDDSVQPKLARHEEPDIDQLMPKIEQAMREYAICKVRLDAVQATLGQYLRAPAPSVGSGSLPRPGGDGDGNAGDDREQDGIPY
jgi:hypothetical protein